MLPASSKPPPSPTDPGTKALPGDPAWARELEPKPETLTEDDVDRIVDAVAAKLLVDGFRGAFRKRLTDWLTRTLNDLGLSDQEVADAVSNAEPEIQARLDELEAKRLDEFVNTTTQQELAAALADTTTATAGQAIADVFERARETRTPSIAETEAVRSANWATQVAFEGGGVEEREWCSMEDLKVRLTHVALDGQVKPVSEPFEVDGFTAMHPGGFGVAALDANCRCFIIEREAPAKAASDRQARREAFEKHLAPWERETRRLLRKGFRAQEAAALAVLRSIRDDKAARLRAFGS